jgi:hypothetical protein
LIRQHNDPASWARREGRSKDNGECKMLCMCQCARAPAMLRNNDPCFTAPNRGASGPPQQHRQARRMEHARSAIQVVKKDVHGRAVRQRRRAGVCVGVDVRLSPFIAASSTTSRQTAVSQVASSWRAMTKLHLSSARLLPRHCAHDSCAREFSRDPILYASRRHSPYPTETERGRRTEQRPKTWRRPSHYPRPTRLHASARAPLWR